MKREIPQEELIIKRNRRKRSWRRFVMAMACVVVFFTTYALILPAITMEHSCSLEEHAHSEGCYENETLVCVMEEHRHDIHCEGTKETETLAETESAQTEEIQAETTSATENSETTATTESAETVVEEMVVTETVPQETQVGDIVMEDSGEQGELFIYTPTKEIGRGTYEGRKLKCGQDGAEGHSHTTDCYEPSTLTWVVTKNTVTGEHTLTIHGKGEMPDSQTPWETVIPYSTMRYIVIGPNTDAENEEKRDAITYIGKGAFGSNYILGVAISNTVQVIGESAFSGARFYTDTLNIPGSVKTIKNGAFFNIYSGISTIILNEGTEFVECPFSSCPVKTIYFPSTAYIQGSMFYGSLVSEVIVDEANSRMKVVDGVLYRLKSDDTWALSYYPFDRPGTKYEVPEEIDGKPVTTVGGFYFSRNLLEVTIPQVDTIDSYAFRSSSVQRIVLTGDTLESSHLLFAGNWNLCELSFENLKSMPGYFFRGCSPITVHIPACMEKIGQNVFWESAPAEVLYDARDAEIAVNSEGSPFALTIGTTVDVLQEGFRYFAEKAETLTFKGPNQITIAEGAMAGAPAPFTDLSGTIYVDEQGVVYTYDDSGATLFFCPPGVEELEVPATLPEMAGSRLVTAVRKDALKYAENLTEIKFADPAAVPRLETLAMANCPTLQWVNSETKGEENREKTTMEEAAASFPNAEMGYNVFYNTGLGGAPGSATFAADMNGGQSVTVTADGAAVLQITAACDGGMAWKDRGDGTGGYKLLTGERVSLNCGTGSIIENQTAWYRVYLRFTNEEGYAPAPGTEEYHGENSWKITYYATEDPYTVCAEFGAPPAGASGGLPIGVYYPHYSRGGGLTVWGVVLEGSPAISGDSEKRPIVESDNVMQFSWSTKANTYDVTKKAASDTALGVSTDSEGVSRPKEDVQWKITVSRNGDEVSDFGKDLVRSVEFRDVMTLPDGISWKGGIKEALTNNKIHYSGGYFYADET